MQHSESVLSISPPHRTHDPRSVTGNRIASPVPALEPPALDRLEPSRANAPNSRSAKCGRQARLRNPSMCCVTSSGLAILRLSWIPAASVERPLQIARASSPLRLPPYSKRWDRLARFNGASAPPLLLTARQVRKLLSLRSCSVRNLAVVAGRNNDARGHLQFMQIWRKQGTRLSWREQHPAVRPLSQSAPKLALVDATTADY